MIKARQKFFGIENVDEKGRVRKDKVIFSWATNTTYIVSAMGRVLLLDSYINRPELPTTPLDTRRTPILPQDFVDARPDAIFLGHGHGDHADNAAYVAKWTNATIYAAPETCDVMQQDVIRMWNDPNLHNGGTKIIPNGDPVKCVGVVPRNSPPGEYTGTLANPTGGTTRSTEHPSSILDDLHPHLQAHPLGVWRRSIRPSRTSRSSTSAIRATAGASSKLRRRRSPIRRCSPSARPSRRPPMPRCGCPGRSIPNHRLRRHPPGSSRFSITSSCAAPTTTSPSRT